MKKVSTFQLNGKPLTGIPKPILNIRNFVTKMKDGDLLSMSELAASTGYTHESLKTERISSHPLLAAYCALIRYPTRQVVWGNAKTIRELLKHKELVIA